MTACIHVAAKNLCQVAALAVVLHAIPGEHKMQKAMIDSENFLKRRLRHLQLPSGEVH